MEFPQDQIDELKEFAPGVLQAPERGLQYFRLPKVRMPEGCSPEIVDLLLCPEARDGYPSRLFFAQHVSCKKSPIPNWNTQRIPILDELWWVYSWKVATGLSLAQLVSAHLSALR